MFLELSRQPLTSRQVNTSDLDAGYFLATKGEVIQITVEGKVSAL